MGYETSLHLVGLKIKSESAPIVKRALEAYRSKEWLDDELPPDLELPGGRGFEDLWDRLVTDREGFLAFRALEDDPDPYEPDEEGTVPAVCGKWYDAKNFAAWVRRHCEPGGRIVQHSREADGAAWGWEFDGQGKMRALGLRPVGPWE